jgi:hypothetical protein
MFNAIAVRFGYDESNSTALLIFVPKLKKLKFSNGKDALYSLTEFLYQKFSNEYMKPVHLNPNCNVDYKNGNYCPRCGMKLIPDELDISVWDEFLRDLMQSNMGSSVLNSYCTGYDEWTPFCNLPNSKNTLYINKCGVEIITMALSYIHPKLNINIQDYLIHKDYFDELVNR